MAKRKNKKRQQAAQNTQANGLASPGAKIASAPASVVPGPKSQPVAPPQPQARRREVGLGTCVAGMFLTLLLGLYLGSLVPDIRDMARRPAQTLAPGNAAAPAIATGQGGNPALADAEPATPAIPAASAPPARPAAPPEGQPASSGSAVANIPQSLASQIRELEAKLGANPHDAGAWIELGNAYFDTARHAQAIHAYEHALEIAPDNPDVLTDMGIMYRETGNFNKALDCFRKASSIDPHHINALFNEGVVLGTDLGRKDEGIAAWRRILVFAPGALTPGGKPLADVIAEMQ